jgi:hypothetical protein
VTRKFDLKDSLARPCPPGENINDDFLPVKRLHPGYFFDIPLLGRAKFAVENDYVRACGQRRLLYLDNLA